ncbi:hypothetical protein [Magnetospirillum sp. 64-120]|uniref:hypothetical protein n=1 Tax=Magnetospirillum sp. 64-120 TaxID=1895778 RepID=UPI00092930B9|nr:hypothetical protein [Magnetospirillum sp. 64-120]OJX81783.1 MAG: hypothetical protein BGO92_15725 [Magnetospirillum sp. 64-120]
MSGLSQWFHDLWRKSFAVHPRRKPKASRDGAAVRALVDPFIQMLEVLKLRPDGGVGRVRAVSLADFRQAVGDKWPRLADKVSIIVDRLIRARLGEANLFRRVDEETWLLLFPKVSPEQARALTVAVVQDISRHLLGEGCVGGTRPLALAAHVDAAQLAATDPRHYARVLRQAVDEARSLFDDRGNGLAEDGQGHIRERLWGERPASRRRPQAEWEPILRRLARPDPDEPWKGVGPIPSDAKLTLLWRPTWVAQSQAIAAYCARVARVDHPGDPPLEGSMAYPDGDPATAETIDRFVSAAAVRDLMRSGPDGGCAIIPLTWASLVGDHRAELAFPFADIPADMRRQRLKVEICRIPDSVTAEQAQNVVAGMRHLCGEVLLRLRLSSPLLRQVNCLGEAKVGLDLSELRDDQRMADDRLLDVLDLLQVSAGQAGVGCYVWSARRRKVVGGVVDGGFDMVNGPGLMRDVARPSMVVPAPKDRFVV